MKRTRSFFPALSLVGIVSVVALGMAIATAQNQTEPKPAQPKTATKAAPETAPPANRAQPATPRGERPPQPGTPRDDRPAAEGQRTAGLGAQFQGQGDQGLQVSAVEPNSAFAQAGLKQNDRIVTVQGMTFSSPRQLDAYLYGQVGRSVPIIIDRGGQRYSINIAVPAATGDGGWLGVYLEEGDANAKGAKITQVYPAGPAARAGLQSGDIIQQIDNQKIEGSSDVVMVVREFQPQAQIELSILRDNEELKIPVVLGNRSSVAHIWDHDRHQQPYQSMYQQGHAQQHQYQQPYQQQGPPRAHQSGEHSSFEGIPPYAMTLEQQRRAAEQNERIEEEIRLLREEVQKLREHLERK